MKNLFSKLIEEGRERKEIKTGLIEAYYYACEITRDNPEKEDFAESIEVLKTAIFKANVFNHSKPYLGKVCLHKYHELVDQMAHSTPQDYKNA
jgi:hypothetical protein